MLKNKYLLYRIYVLFHMTFVKRETVWQNVKVDSNSMSTGYGHEKKICTKTNKDIEKLKIMHTSTSSLTHGIFAYSALRQMH